MSVYNVQFKVVCLGYASLPVRTTFTNLKYKLAFIQVKLYMVA